MIIPVTGTLIINGFDFRKQKIDTAIPEIENALLEIETGNAFIFNKESIGRRTRRRDFSGSVCTVGCARLCRVNRYVPLFNK